MKMWLGVLVVVLTTHPSVFAQSPEGASSEKLKAPFAAKSAWFTDLEKAKAEAKRSERRIFVYFSKEG